MVSDGPQSPVGGLAAHLLGGGGGKAEAGAQGEEEGELKRTNSKMTFAGAGKAIIQEQWFEQVTEPHCCMLSLLYALYAESGVCAVC